MRKKLIDFTDEKGCLVQKHLNGVYNAIDSNYLTTNYLYQDYVAGNANILSLGKCFEFLDDKNNIIRYWENKDMDSESRLWSDSRTVSRDNSMGIICCLVELQEKEIIRKLAKDILKRKSFFQNVLTVKGVENIPDYCIAEWAVILRGLGTKMLYPLYYGFDFLFMLSTVIYIIKNKTDNNYNSPLFHMVSQVECINRNSSTFFGKISKWLMYNHIPGNKIYTDKEPVISQLMEYSRMHYDPPIYNATIDLLKRYRL